MEGLRGFSALIVFFVHFNALFRSYVNPDSWTAIATQFAASVGHTGVDIFFVLSGFLIYGITLTRFNGYVPFLKRRYWRLYPVFLVVFAMYLAASFAFPAYSKIPPEPGPAAIYLLANLLMLPGIFEIVPMITVAWSLSYEFLFYLLIPVIVGALGMRRWSPAWRLIATLVFSVLLLAACKAEFLHHPRLAMFLCGMTLYETVTHFDAAPRLNKMTEALSALSFVAVLFFIGFTSMSTGETIIITELPIIRVALLFFSVLGLCLHAMFFDGFLNECFRWDYIRWFGNMSYSYYLAHGLILHCLRLFLHATGFPARISEGWFLLLMAVCFLITAAAAGALFVLIESRQLDGHQPVRNVPIRTQLVETGD